MDIKELDKSQLEAVLCIDAPSLVIAGAGSGKTRVLTYKIAYLLEQGMQPWNILALTFTNKAAREMRDRIATLVSPEKAAALWMGTFHSIFARILRTEGHRLGYDRNYTIYDTADGLSLIKQIIREMDLDEKVYKPSAVQSRISAAKNHLILPSRYASIREFRDSDQMTQRTLTPEIYNRYQERCKQANAMDFDDLLLNTWLLFDHSAEAADAWQERFHFVLVDEYQDTNFAQHQIIRQLTSRRQRVCVVGDDAQSIYSFRGAEIDNILHFRENYPGARLFKLERNYRSTQTIVGAAGCLIQSNRQQIPKQVFSEKEVGSPIALFSAYSDTDEANIILREIQRARRAGIAYKDIAILYRTNAQSRKIEDSLMRGHIPYHIYAGMSFYQREEIKDLLCYLRLSVNPYDEQSLQRIINKPARGIGNTTIRKLFDAAKHAERPVWDTLRMMKEQGAGTLKRLEEFYDMMASFHDRATTDDAYTLARHIAIESGLWNNIFSGHDPEDITRQENLQEMLDGIAGFVQDNLEQGLGTLLSDYLQQASLATDLDRNKPDEDADHVNMMTIHTAKGLEFPVVFITGLEEGLFPSEMSEDSPRALEEERRLFYVALTRAERKVILTYAKERFRFGRRDYMRPSRFIREIPQQFFRSNSSSHTTVQERPRSVIPAMPFPHGSRATVQERPATASGLEVGTTVLHDRFGRGVVQRIEGSGIDAKATVCFDNAGTKVLMLRFAKLNILQ